MDKEIDKDVLVHRIARLVIKLSEKFHIPEKDPVGELYNTILAVDTQVGQEMERIRMRERGEIA